jgi:hypothetical protein
MKTNRLIMALFALVLVVGVYLRCPKPAAISGDYYLTGSIQLQDTVSDNSFSGPLLDTLYTITTPIFRFSDNDSLYVHPILVPLLFNDTLFHYEVNLHTLRLSTADTCFSIPYDGEGNKFRLRFYHPLIKWIDLNPEHTHAHGVYRVGLTVK